MAAEHAAFTWAAHIPGLKTLPAHVSNGVLVSILLMIFVLIGYKQLKKKEDDLVPDSKFSVRNIIELIVQGISVFLGDTIGPNGRKYILIVGTLAIFILFNNLSGLVPGFLPATDNTNTTFACALVVFFMTHYYGFREQGPKYLKHFVFINPDWPWFANALISVLLTPIEIIGHLARPLSLGLRLFGNIYGDHLVTATFIALVPLLVPIGVMTLGLFISIVQAFVFMLLAMVYFSLAVAHEEH